VNPAQAPIVIVGAGQTAARAAHALRASGWAAGIVVVGDEVHRPYERPPLSKAVLSDAEEPVLDVLPAQQFDGCGLQFIAGVRAERLDPLQRTVTLADGRALAYSQCLLATGGRARTLPALPPGTGRVHYLRSLDDARRLRAALAPGVRLVVVGGGFLGLEAAASARGRGAEVTVVEAAPALLARFLPPDAGAWLADAIAARGLALRLGRGLRSAHAGADGVELLLDDGEVLHADQVLVAIGLEPETGLARTAGLAIDPGNGGIAVDALCRSSDPHVFAAGDCASQFNPHLGLQLRLESWQNANEQARAAAAGMLGLAQPVAPYPWFWTDQGAHNLQMLGLAGPDLAYVRRGDPGANAQALWIGHRAGVPVHGIALNAGGELRALRALFDARAPFDPDAFVAHAGPLRAWVKATLAAA
jgi:NADPH-dependent 2,4-dienoyl-CoA reductase/sulfur reductase-like enzyme